MNIPPGANNDPRAPWHEPLTDRPWWEVELEMGQPPACENCGAEPYGYEKGRFRSVFYCEKCLSEIAQEDGMSIDQLIENEPKFYVI